MTTFNIYLTGVGGQGIGLLSEILLRAADHAGCTVRGVDTHGLAQRGGIVASQIRLGGEAHSPLIMSASADLVVALERHEALRALNSFAKNGGVLVYYDTVWQPLAVRLGSEPEVHGRAISDQCKKKKVKEVKIFDPGLADARMQNIAVLSCINHCNFVPKVKTKHYKAAMKDLMAGEMLKKNMALFSAP